MGCDLLQRLVNSSQFIGFNPRTRTGCDTVFALRVITTACFNPRTRTGCDLNFLVNLFNCILFQSTHPHGVRRSNL